MWIYYVKKKKIFLHTLYDTLFQAYNECLHKIIFILFFFTKSFLELKYRNRNFKIKDKSSFD